MSLSGVCEAACLKTYVGVSGNPMYDGYEAYRGLKQKKIEGRGG